MGFLRATGPDGLASAFLVERYLPRSAVAELGRSVGRVAGICTGPGIVTTGVRYLQAIYLPGEEICFCLFQAPSIQAVRAVNDAGQFPIDRITEALLMPCNQSARHSPVDGKDS